MSGGSGGAGMFFLGMFGCFLTTIQFVETTNRMDELKVFLAWDLLVVGWYGFVSLAAVVCMSGGATQRYCTWLVLATVFLRAINVLIQQSNGQFDTPYSDALFELFLCLLAALICFISLVESTPSSEGDRE